MEGKLQPHRSPRNGLIPKSFALAEPGCYASNDACKAANKLRALHVELKTSVAGISTQAKTLEDKLEARKYPRFPKEARIFPVRVQTHVGSIPKHAARLGYRTISLVYYLDTGPVDNAGTTGCLSA